MTPPALVFRAPTAGPTTHSLTPELMAEASWRLGWLGLVYACGSIAANYGRRALLALAGFGVDWRFHGSDVLGATAAVMGIAVFVVSRRRCLSPTRMLHLGLVFQVAVAFALAAREFWEGFPPIAVGSFLFVPAECGWIVTYPLAVPNTPNKVLIASLLAASMGPAALALSPARGTTIDRPLVYAAYFLTSNYLCAVIAYAVACIVHRFSIRLTHARDIGSYELIERLGAGGMGEVWRAKHRLLARPAAIKLIRRDLLGASERVRDAVVRRFEREAHDTAALESIHTIDVYDFGITEHGDFARFNRKPLSIT